MKNFTLPSKQAAMATLWLVFGFALGLSASAIAQTERKVQIQTKFIEISEEAAQELGFDWLIAPIPESGTRTGGGGEPFTSGGNSGSSPVTGQLAETSYDFQIDETISTAGNTTTMAPGAIGISNVLTDAQFQMVMRAIHQQPGTDILTAPRVLTRNGQKAKIEITREFIYPTEYDPPEIPAEFTGFNFFNPGETQFNIGVGGALGDLSETLTSTTTMRGVSQVERTGTQSVRVGEKLNPKVNRTAQQLNQVQQQLLVVTNPIQANQLLRQQNRLFRQLNRQTQNQPNVPVFESQEFTYVENIPYEQQIEQLHIEGIMDEDSPKLAAGFTHFFDNHLGFGGQFEWIQGNLSDGFLGQAELTWREPMEFDNFGLAPFVTGGIGGITGDAINEFVGSVAGGVEFRLQNDVGIYTEYSHIFLGNGMDFGQILAGINVVIGGRGIPKKPPAGGGGGGSLFMVTPVTPAEFESRNVGVTLEVEPTVGADGQTIDLQLAPEVVEFEGFINYGSPITTDAVDADGQPTTVTLTESRIELPIFKTRKAKTRVTVMDGQTAVIGGLVKEEVQVVEDKVPILGDIPLIGRLFRSRVENHMKRNLVIFVSAELIDPAGE